MARFKVKDAVWQKVNVLDKECLFSDVRIDRDSVPDGCYMYEVRHSDNDWCEPVEIALGVLVNFFGTILVKEPFLLETLPGTNNAYLWIDEAEWEYLD